VANLLPLTGAVVDPTAAPRVVAPPFDSLTDAQRRQLATDEDSFLGALPPPISPGHDLDVALARCRQRIADLARRGRFHTVDGPFLGVLELRTGARTTTAVVGDLAVDAYLDGHVLPHEHVRPARVGALARYLAVVGVASSPVAVTHRPHAAVAAATDTVTSHEPELAHRSADGVEVRWWTVRDPTTVATLTAAIDRVGTLFVADGHHRAAAVARARADGGDLDDRVLTAIVPVDHLAVLPFHRRAEGIADPAGTLRRLLADRGLDAEPLDGPAVPEEPGTVTVVAGDGWWRLDLRARRRGGVVDGLDVALVGRELLDPLVSLVPGAQVDPVAAPLGLGALTGPDAIGVALVGPDLEEILQVASAGEVVPPKTTYITPKLRSGVLLLPRSAEAHRLLGTRPTAG
jgi:uncharacterized protein (DUF1015 family)